MCPICDAQKSLRSHCESLKKQGKSISSKLNEQLNAINQHQLSVLNQQSSFQEQEHTLDPRKCIIIIDFKENIRIRCGPVQFKKDFYNYNQLSILGFSVITKDSSGNKVIKYYDFISEILSHDSLFAGECIIELFKLTEMKKFTNVSI